MNITDGIVASAIVSLSLFCSTISQAGPTPEWSKAALNIVGSYEGEGFSQVTADRDCQGLSLGIEQSTVLSGSLLSIVKAMSEQEFADTVNDNLAEAKRPFLEIIALLREADALGPKAGMARRELLKRARFKSLELQDVEETSKCDGGRRGKAVKPKEKSELRAWLKSDPVRLSQEKVAQVKLDLSFKITECFMRDAQSKSEDVTKDIDLRFSNFLFIYGWVVQGGGGLLTDNALRAATARVKEYAANGTTETENMRRKIAYISDWLAVQWSNAESKTYYTDAMENSLKLKTASATLRPVDVHLLFMRLVRAMTGNTPYQLAFMNRGIIDLTGEGRVNNTPFDHREKFKRLGAASHEDRASVFCD